MSDFGDHDVERMLRMPRSAILALVRAGFVTPKRGDRRDYRFSFQDLILLRTARALRAARVSPRRITRSLRELRRSLPDAVPLSGLRISAVGDRVVVTEGRSRWQAESGQYLLDLEVSVADGELSLLSRGEPAPPPAAAEEWFSRGVATEAESPERAREAYERSVRWFEAAGDAAGVAGSLQGLGDVALDVGDAETALVHYRAALGRLPSVDKPFELLYVLGGFAAASAVQGNNGMITVCESGQKFLLQARSLDISVRRTRQISKRVAVYVEDEVSVCLALWKRGRRSQVGRYVHCIHAPLAGRVIKKFGFGPGDTAIR